jgi:glyoxylase-like metal-dependent hydrolase (beta-lactamase superfamily II)
MKSIEGLTGPQDSTLARKEGEEMDHSIPLRIGNIEIRWLSGGDFRLDGGTMFGPVPKVLWQKRYPVDQANCIPMCNDPLLVKTSDALIVIDSGLGNKLSEKQRSIFQVSTPWDIPHQLHGLGIDRQDIDLLIMTHGDFDHAGGIEMITAEGDRELTFPRATHMFQEMEWQDLTDPSGRAKATYLADNFGLLRRKGQYRLIKGESEVCPGITIRHAGGHTQGHQLVEIASKGESAFHLGDLCPTHAHTNPLWVMAYDNFPLEAIEQKSALLKECLEKNSWLTLYHDPFIRAIRLDADGRMNESHPAPEIKRNWAAQGCGVLPETTRRA